MKKSKRWLSLLTAWGMFLGIYWFSGVSLVSASPLPECDTCGGGGDHAPLVIQINAPSAVGAYATAKGALVWQDEDGDANWVQFQMCQNENIGCVAVGGWNPNPTGLTAGSVEFDITCNGLTGSWTGMAQVSDKANNSSGWRTYSFECTPPQKLEEEEVGNVTEVVGTVTVQSSDGTVRQLQPGMTLQPGDVIVSGGDGFLRMTRQDGTNLRMFKNSQFQWMPPSTSTKIKRFFGRLWHGVVALIVPKQQPENPLAVQASYIFVGIRGTTFTIASNPDIQQDTVSVEEGTVEITPSNPALQPFMLEAGHQVQVAADTIGPITPIDSGPTPSPTPPPSGGGSSLKSYDTNNNDRIEDEEFFKIIDAWLAGQIDDPTFFKATDLWISQQPITSSGILRTTLSVNSVVLTTNAASHEMTFVAQGQGITSIGVEIFDLGDKRIFAEEATGTRLSWDLSTPSGRPVADGVYLYVVTLQGTKGTNTRTDIEKLLVLR